MWSGNYPAGDFRERAKFMEPVAIDDGYGNVRRGHEVAAIRWVDLVELSAREISEAGTARDTTAATLRVRTDRITKTITSLWAVDVRDIVWSITGIKSLGKRNEVIEMTVERGVAR